jgi:hypothetical protein
MARHSVARSYSERRPHGLLARTACSPARPACPHGLLAGTRAPCRNADLFEISAAFAGLGRRGARYPSLREIFRSV